MKREYLGLAAPFILVGVLGCDRGKPAKLTAEQEAAPTAVSWSQLEVPPAPEFSAALIEKGKAVYNENCFACHGENGDAKGKCGPFLKPQPRDFTSGVFRFKTTQDSELPTNEDLFRTISVGLNATGMPPWRYLLSAEERWASVAYIKTFFPGFEKEKPGKSIDLGEPPAKTTTANIDHGKEIFEQAQCGKCHGETGYGDGPSSETLKDGFGHPIAPRNFHRAGDFKRGHKLEEIALTIHTGNNGTPMPGYGDAFTKEDIWDLASYIISLADKGMMAGGTPAAAHMGTDHGEPDVVVKLSERAWEFVPNVIRVKQGQLVRIDYQPTDNGLGVGHGFAIDGYDRATFINGAMVQRPKSVTFRADTAGKFTFYCATQCSTGALHPKMNGTFIVETATN